MKYRDMLVEFVSIQKSEDAMERETCTCVRCNLINAMADIFEAAPSDDDAINAILFELEVLSEGRVRFHEAHSVTLSIDTAKQMVETAMQEIEEQYDAIPSNVYKLH